MAELSRLSDEELLKRFAKACDTNRLLTFQPYGWQEAFIRLGAVAKERLLIAANGVGKTYTIAAETHQGLWSDCPYRPCILERQEVSEPKHHELRILKINEYHIEGIGKSIPQIFAHCPCGWTELVHITEPAPTRITTAYREHLT